jgi:glycosyltransferase involved in cell wall biosynthesis
MKVLVVHNRYRSAQPSGENAAVDNQIRHLLAAGVEVVTYFRSSDEIDAFAAGERLTLAARPIYSREDSQALRALMQTEQPDLVHLHNPYPLISPWVIRVASEARVPIVQTVHNRRFFCANGLAFRDGSDCSDCAGHRFAFPAVRHACYRDSKVQSLVMAGSLAAHRSTWDLVDRFLPVSEELAAEMRLAGVHNERLTVVPNGVDDPLGAEVTVAAPPNVLLYVGRLDTTKGIHLLLDAWQIVAAQHPTAMLRIVGDGDERPAVAERAAQLPRVSLLGTLERSGVFAAMQAASVVVVPSLSKEALSVVVIEALAAGRPVIATRSGAVRSLVDDSVGWSVDAKAASLAHAMGEALSHPEEVAHRGAAGRHRFLSDFTREVATAKLLSAYSSVIMAKRSSSKLRRVVVVSQRVPQYRVPFFDGLRNLLRDHGIQLEVLEGGSREGELRGDAAELPWAIPINYRRLAVGQRELITQSVLKRVADADLVIVEQASKLVTNNALLIWRRIGGPKVAFWGHGRNRNDARRSRVGEWWKNKILSQSDWFFGYTSGVVDEVVHMGFPRERVTDVCNAIDTTQLRRLRDSVTAEETAVVRSELGLGDGPVGLFVGSLVPEKSIAMLAEIGDRVRCEVPGFQLVVAGEGPERPVLESLARSRSWMNLVGAKFGADLAAIASTASVMVIPGWVGLVVIDAAALGLPLVTTDRPEHSVEIDYLTDGVNGLICSNNAMVMGDAIAELLGDPQRLAAMSEAALELAQTATIENMCQRFGAGVLACLNGEPSPA